MQTTYGRNPGGYLWAIARPTLGLALFTLVITLGLRVRTPSIGTNFPLFIATGLLPLGIFTNLTEKIARGLRSSRSLLTYPVVRWSDVLIARFFVNALTEILVFIIILGGILIVYDLGLIINYGAILVGLSLSFLLAFSIGCFNCVFRSVWPVWDAVWGILTRPLFLISPVIFTFHDVPREFEWFFLLNPLTHTIGYVRQGFFATYDGSHLSWIYVAVVSLLILAFSLIMLRRYHIEIIERS
jgi:capsular polysaccharide transport system permease protein